MLNVLPRRGVLARLARTSSHAGLGYGLALCPVAVCGDAALAAPKARLAFAETVP